MNPKQLLAHFDRIADAPGAIPRLRRFILDLAVRGKLVEQDVNDEPASELLKRIKEERNNVVVKGKRRSGEDRPILDHEVPFPISSEMVFARLSTIAKIEKGSTGIQKAKPGQYTLVTLAEDRGSSAEYQFDTAAAIVPLISSTGHGHASLKRMHYQEGKFALGNILCAVIPFVPELISARYLYEYLWAYKEPLLVAKMIGTANVSLTIGKIGEAPIPIISPRSQERLHELMALCDQLEAAQAERENRRDTLVAASLQRMNNGADAKEYREYARFHLGHLPRMATRVEHVKQLRQSILNLAVRGKLVEQDANDEPAEVLLNRGLLIIQNSSRHKSQEMLLPSGYPIPQGWMWVRLGDIAKITMGNSPPGDSYNEYGEGVPLINGPVEFSPGPFGHTVKSKFTTKPTKFCDVNDLLVCVRGSTTGRTNIAAFRACIGRGVAAIQAHHYQKFVNLIMLWSRHSLYAMGTGSTFPSISQDQLTNLTFLSPPLAEQHRIVAKVDELMALCDELEAQLTTAETERSRLLEALLHEALLPAIQKKGTRRRVKGEQLTLTLSN